MTNYKLTTTDGNNIIITFNKFDSPLSERTFTITDVDLKDDPDGDGGIAEFRYVENGKDATDTSDSITSAALAEVFREIIAMMINAMKAKEHQEGN